MDADEFAKLVGLNVKKARWLKGFTQEAAAARIGISYRYYREIEVGRRNPTLDVLLKVAVELGVTVADLVEVEGSRPMRPALFSREAQHPGRGRSHR